MRILNNLDLRQNQLLQAVVHNLAQAPLSPVKGQIYFNTTDHKFYGYGENGWLDLSYSFDDSDIQATLTALRQDIDAEVSRATAKEAELEGKISANASNIADLQSSLADTDSDLDAEIERATQAEEGLKSSIDAEVVRAKAKEEELNNAIEAEVSRAESEEARIEGLVTAEADRAKAEESKIRGEFAAADTAMSEALTGKITEVSGKLAADKIELQGNIDTVSGVANQNKSDIAQVKEDLAQEVTDRKAADQAQDVVIATKADKSYVDLELGKKAEKVHTHVMADITDLGTVAGLDAGNGAGQVPVLDEHGKLAMSTIPTLAINETKVVESIEEAMALNQKSGDIVVINPTSTQRVAIVEKYNADQKNLAKGFQVLDVNILNDEFAGYLAQGKTTFICVEPEAETFEERYRPLNSLADTMNRAEIEGELAKKADKTEVSTAIQGAKDYADAQIGTAKNELTNAINTAKNELETSISNLDRKVDGVDAKVDANSTEITSIKQAASELKAVVDAHVADKVSHITAEERTSWNERTKKVVASIGDAAAKEFEVAHNLGSEDVMVTVKAADTKEVVFTDVKVKDENTIVVSFGMIPAENEFKVVVIG